MHLAMLVRLAGGLPHLTIYDTHILRYPASYRFLTSKLFRPLVISRVVMLTELTSTSHLVTLDVTVEMAGALVQISKS